MFSKEKKGRRERGRGKIDLTGITDVLFSDLGKGRNFCVWLTCVAENLQKNWPNVELIYMFMDRSQKLSLCRTAVSSDWPKVLNALSRELLTSTPHQSTTPYYGPLPFYFCIVMRIFI